MRIRWAKIRKRLNIHANVFGRHIILEIDEVLLPHACRDDGNVVFTVVSGKVVGSFAGNDQK